MIEFQTNETSRIALSVIAAAFQQKLGPTFAVYADANTEPEDDRVVAVLQATRIPFAVDGVNVETMELQLSFDVNILKATEKEEVLKKINTLLGWLRFTAEVTEAGTTRIYEADCFLERRMTGDARPDTGEIMLVYQLGGTALVSEITDGGPITGNRVKTELNGHELKITSYAPSMTKGAQNILRLSRDEARSETFEILKANSYNLTFLYTGNEVEDEIVMAAENGDDNSAPLNKFYTLKRTYPNGSVSRVPVKLYSASVQASPGAFITVTAAFIRDDTGGQI